jgi:hypothetical protein
MSQWFRMYAEVLNDPKAQRLSGDEFKAWINVLCLASQHDGAIPTDEDISFALRLDVKKAKKIMATLVTNGLIDVSETGRNPHNWDKRQYKSDVSTERVKRFRERSKPVAETPVETAPDTDTETDVPLSNDNGCEPSIEDPDQAFWTSAKSYLGPSKASLIGKWRGEYGLEAVVSAIMAAQTERPVDKVSFIAGVLRRGAKANAPLLPV